jgi:hypothetical protein
MSNPKNIDPFAGLMLSKEWSAFLQADFQWKAQECKIWGELPFVSLPPQLMPTPKLPIPQPVVPENVD